jgi:hypothetical protein
MILSKLQVEQLIGYLSVLPKSNKFMVTQELKTPDFYSEFIGKFNREFSEEEFVIQKLEFVPQGGGYFLCSVEDEQINAEFK